MKAALDMEGVRALRRLRRGPAAVDKAIFKALEAGGLCRGVPWRARITKAGRLVLEAFDLGRATR